jgi:Rieske 2Fe-2S family protein
MSTSTDSRLTQADWQRIENWIAVRKSGFSLPGPFYWDEAVYRADVERVWRRAWLFAGHSCQIPKPGDFFTYELDTDCLIIIRGNDGAIRALHNTCRHRGTRLTSLEWGHVSSLVCPYHQWVYARDGRLISCHGMHGEIDRQELGLHEARLHDLEGLLYVSLADEPPDFYAVEDAIAPRIRPQGFPRARIAKILDYDVHANWKLVWENNRECYHCNVNHPQYIKANFDHYNADDTSQRIQNQIDAAIKRNEAKWAESGYSITHQQSGMTVFPDADRDVWYSSNRTPLAEGYVSETMDGRQVAPLMGDYTDPDVGTLRMRSVPNFWNHASCDHAVSTRLTAAGPQRTKVRVMWLVHEDAKEGIDYRLEELLPFWQLTSEQDWRLCELAQQGVNSRAYTPGPYSIYKEYNVENFVRWYLKRLSVDST